MELNYLNTVYGPIPERINLQFSKHKSKTFHNPYTELQSNYGRKKHF